MEKTQEPQEKAEANTDARTETQRWGVMGGHGQAAGEESRAEHFPAGPTREGSGLRRAAQDTGAQAQLAGGKESWKDASREAKKVKRFRTKGMCI